MRLLRGHRNHRLAPLMTSSALRRATSMLERRSIRILGGRESARGHACSAADGVPGALHDSARLLGEQGISKLLELGAIHLLSRFAPSGMRAATGPGGHA